ncbi:MAG TPA: fructose-bisphosphatase class III, partial [Gammaproteobacteria bacterium]|nr:fructose-bisphosphatase class III [Gammaproteobacteria bacterium]
MANYAIGDVQGCFNELQGLLDEINFDPTEDRLWFVGDLINRGPESRRTLEFIYQIKKSCNLVLGNHDMHFLAIAEGLRRPFKNDTLQELLESEKLNIYIKWLRCQSLLHYE